MTSITLEDGIKILRHIEKIIEPLDAHAALTGGTAFRGVSNKDVDIIIYPHKLARGYDKQVIMRAIAESSISDPDEFDVFGGVLDTICSPETKPIIPGWLSSIVGIGNMYQCTSGYVDKDVCITIINGIRVDLIFM